MQLYRGLYSAEFMDTARGQLIGQGLYQNGGFGLSYGNEALREGVVADGAGDVLTGGGERAGRGEGDVGGESLGQGSLFFRHTDAAGEFQGVDADGISRRQRTFFQQALQVAQVGHGDVRCGLGELVGVVVAGEYADTGDADAVSGVDIVLHVTDEGGFLRAESVLSHEAGDVVLLVVNPGVDVLEVVVEVEVA